MQGPYDILATGLIKFTVAGTGRLIGWPIPVLPTAVASMQGIRWKSSDA